MTLPMRGKLISFDEIAVTETVAQYDYDTL